MCIACGQSFSKAAITHLPSRCCPACRSNRGYQPNRTLSETLSQMQPINGGTRCTGDGLVFEYQMPFKVIFTGSFGTGKSSAINMFVDPTGNSTVTSEGNGAVGQTQHVTKVFPGDASEGTIMFHGRQVRIQIFDTPGFGDPDKSEATLLHHLSAATLEMAGGVDAFVHVVKLGRMTELDRKLPELLLSGLAHDADSRKELASRWIFLVTHCDSQRTPASVYSLEQFRGGMKQFFPAILDEAANRAIFVENGRTASQSPYGNAADNKDKLLDQITKMRIVYHRAYKSCALDVLLKKALTETFADWTSVQNTFENPHELSALLQHFKAVVQAKKFIAMTPATMSNLEFHDKWNELSLATRDEVAVDMAQKVLRGLEAKAEDKWRQILIWGYKKSCSTM